MISVGNRHKLADLIIDIFGYVFFAKAQACLKFWFNFRKDYSFSASKSRRDGTCQRVVFMIDGKTIHGGLSDRLRGLFSTYHYCKEFGKEFKICWTYPFRLDDYLRPKYPWLLRPEELCYNLKDVDFRFFNSYNRLNNNPKKLFALMKSSRKEVHVYSNVLSDEQLFSQFFNELFTPSQRVQEVVNECLKATAWGGVYFYDFQVHRYTWGF